MSSAGVATSSNRSSMPRSRQISTVRWLTMCARGLCAVPGCFSTSRCATPWRDRDSEVARPAGPAPTTRTGVVTSGIARPYGTRGPTVNTLIPAVARVRPVACAHRAQVSTVSAVANGSRDNTAAIHRQLREAILHGRLEAGAELSQVKLADDFGVSRGPVREALRLLEREGLVEAELNRRVRVASFSPSD